jgi:signal transduction histidine kinase
MTDPSRTTRHPDRINGHATNIKHVYSRHYAGFPEMLQQGNGNLSNQLLGGAVTLHSHQRGSENGPHSEFMTVFSHELRNSLNAISSATRILHMEILPGPAAVRACAVIERQVGQMARLVEDLLDVSRVRSGHLRLQSERIDLCAVAAQAVQSVEFVMQERGHRMATAFPEAPVWLQADPTRLEQVLVNLLTNAAKYTEAGGEVALSVEQGENEAIVRIRDTGIGISSDVLPHVFDLFVQANPTSRGANAGLGIGLALVRSLIEFHGGRVTAASAGLGRGSEFTIQLPTRTEL